MGRQRQMKYWNQVTEKGNGMVNCNKCGFEFYGTLSRIRGHVECLPNSGISACPNADQPQEPINAANSLQADPDDHEGVHNIVPSGSTNQLQEPINAANSLQADPDDHEGVHNIVPSGSANQPQEPINAANSLQGLAHNGIKEKINHLNQIISDLQNDEGDIKEQVQLLASRGKKRKREVGSWLQKLEGLRGRVEEMTQSPLLSSIEELTNEVEEHQHRKPLVLTNEIVGANFENNFREIWELLKKDKIFIIGIYGMPGVGKSLLASHLEDEIRRKRTFSGVFWVTVSPSFSISKLQRDIAKRIDIQLDDEDDERTRATILSSALDKKEKSILILDDVWKCIDLEKVGIPLRVNGIKVILTTRLKQVCQQMDCAPHSMIKMVPLDYEYKEEDRELFLRKLGHQGKPAKLSSSEIDEIARDILKMFEGLPPAINVMARIMKGKLNNAPWWKHTLNKLEKGEMGEEMEQEVLELFKLSYDNLMDKDLQNCFLYCALLPAATSRNEIIMKFVDKGLINGKRSLQKIFDEGSTVLDKLKAHSFIKSSHILRSLACYIMRKSNRYAIFKYLELPLLHEWTRNLEIVSVLDNRKVEIPEEMSPECPNLSTLVLFSAKICSIPECFFMHMNSLTVLDLSRNQILTSLPKSLSHLKSLVSLILTGCCSLEYVPPLGDLQSLSRLDISHCLLKAVPQGLEMLINLTWLDLSSNENLTWTSMSVISRLINMQYLDLRNSGIEMTAEDIGWMTVLECFGGTFLDRKTYNGVVQEILNGSETTKSFYVGFGIIQQQYMLEFGDRSVQFGDCEEFDQTLLPTAFGVLLITNNNHWTCLCNGLSSDNASCSSSWQINICSCEKLQSLFCSADCCLSCKSLCHQCSTLEKIEVQDCPSMKEIFGNAPSRKFWGLKHIHISECHAIEYLLTAAIVPQLQNLEKIRVLSCNSMKQIFASCDNYDSLIELPMLTELELCRLPELTMVCEEKISCESLKPSSILRIEDCPKLERVPIIEGCTYSDLDAESDSDFDF